MDIRKVKKLIELLNESGIGEIEVTEGEESVRITKETKSIKIPSNDSQLEKTSASKTIKEEPSLPKRDTSSDDGYEVLAPMVGTFYAAPEPGASPYVQVGDHVNQGDTLCIIEAMKMMNQIEADVPGTIKSVRIQNGEPVEFEQLLFVIDQGKPE